MTNIVVTPSTSLVLIRNMSSPTNVYLSTFNAPNFTVTIRDTTGLPNIGLSTVRISTIGSARFLDGTNLYTLNKPYGLVNVAFRNSSFWQILHTSAQSPATAAANVNTLNASTLFTSFLSSGTKRVSSLTVNSLLTTTEIRLFSTFIIENLSAPGIVVVQSTLNIYGDVLLDKQLFVSGATEFQGSLFVRTLQTLSGITRVISSVGVGGNLRVGGPVTVGSTLHTYSTNAVQTVQVQRSSQIVLDTAMLQVGMNVSTLLGMTVSQLFVTPSSLSINGAVSSFGGTLSTQSLDVGKETTLFQTLSSYGNATLFSTLNLASSLTVRGSASLSTNLQTYGTLFTGTVSSFQLSTLSSFSTFGFQSLSSGFLSSGLSTTRLQGFSWMSIGSYFYTPGVISSLRQTEVGGDIRVQGPSVFGSGHISSSVGVGLNLAVFGSTQFGAVTFQSSMRFADATSYGPVYVSGNVVCVGDMFVDSNMRVVQGAVTNFFVNSFLLSNVEITTSTPITTFRASTLNASSIETSLTQILETNPSYLAVGSTFASTTRFALAVAENTRVGSVNVSNVFWGPRQTSLAEESRPQFVLNAPSLFPQGLSAMSIRADTLNTNILSGSFIGDGANLSNVAVPYSYLSALKTFASTIRTSTLYTSSILVSSFTNYALTTVLSSVVMESLLIQGTGYQTTFSTNQILTLSPRLMVINRNLYFDRLRNRIGVNLSSPLYDLDISGTLFASNVNYSSINELSFSTTGTAFFSSVYASNATVRDSLFYENKGIQVITKNTTDGIPQYFLIKEAAVPASTFGLFSYPSSLGLNNCVFVHNNTQSVYVNGFEDGLLSSEDTFTSQGRVSTQNGFFSTLKVTDFAETKSLFTQSFRIQYSLQVSTNVLSTTETKLFMNNLLTMDNASTTYVGVKTLTPSYGLDVRGNVFMSSIECLGEPRQTYLQLGSLFV